MTVVATEARGAALYARLSSPEVLNSLDEELVAGLERALDAVDQDPGLRALVIEGSPEVFSVGLGPTSRERLLGDPEALPRFIASFNRLLRRLETAPIPVVAVARGTVRAGGFELLLACDIVLVSDDARISDNHLASSAVPGGGGATRAVVRLGYQRAAWMVLTSRWISGPEAVACGLALAALPADELELRATALVDDLCAHSRAALAATKEQMRAACEMPYERALAASGVVFAAFMGSGAGRGGVPTVAG